MTWSGKGKVAVVGIGFSELSRHSEKTLGRLAFDAADNAIADAGLAPGDIDGLATYIMGGTGRDGVDSVSADYFLKHYPSRRTSVGTPSCSRAWSPAPSWRG